MLASRKMTEFYTPTPAMPDKCENTNGDDVEFMRWLKVTIDCAAKLAPYQSPTLKAIYLETKEHEKAKPRTIEEVLAQVEDEGGVEGRKAFEVFLKKMVKIKEEQAG